VAVRSRTTSHRRSRPAHVSTSRLADQVQAHSSVSHQRVRCADVGGVAGAGGDAGADAPAKGDAVTAPALDFADTLDDEAVDKALDTQAQQDAAEARAKREASIRDAGPVVVTVADVESEDVHWLWQDRIPSARSRSSKGSRPRQEHLGAASGSGRHLRDGVARWRAERACRCHSHFVRGWDWGYDSPALERPGLISRAYTSSP